MSLTTVSTSVNGSRSSISSFTASDPTHQRLLAIFQKVRTGIVLTGEEKDFLTTTSKFSPSTREWLGSFVRTPPDDASVREIDALSQRILRKEVTSTAALDQVEQRLVAKNNLTKKETASLARLIESCLSRGGSFSDVLADFTSNEGRNPKRSELIDLVDQFNSEALPRPSQAGTAVCQTTIFDIPKENPIYDPHSVFEIRYDRNGQLEIIEGPVAPMDRTSRQTLTAAQRQEMNQLYHSLADTAYYNNMGEFLEFMSHCRRQKAESPDMSLREAYASYKPDLGQVFDKYQSGTCILLATKFTQEAAKRGVEMQCVGKQTFNPWSKIPIPGAELRWYEFTKEIRGVDHTDVVCIYDDGTRPDVVTEYQCSFGDKAQDVREWRSVERYFDLGRGIDNDSQNLPNRIVDGSEIGKARLKGRYKAIMRKGNMILGVDFLRGNFYINSSLAKTMKDVPTNARGLVSIDLRDLANPDQMGTYFIEGAPVELTHRQALRMILEQARANLVLPADTEENLIELSRNTPELFEGFFVRPLPEIKKHYDDLAAIHQKLTELEPELTATREGYKQLQDWRSEYDEIQLAFAENRFSEIQDRILRLKAELFK